MPGSWEWWYDTSDDGEYGSARDRDDAIASGLRDVDVGESFKIIEARSSSASEYEGADWVPFTHTRNPEWVTKTADGFTVGPA